MADTDKYNTRAERILLSKISGSEYTDPPQTRIEELLLQLGPGEVDPGSDFSKDDIDDAMSDISKDNGQLGPRERGLL